VRLVSKLATFALLIHFRRAFCDSETGIDMKAVVFDRKQSG